MIELKKALYTQINNAHDYNTYDSQAIQTASFPYVVYKLLPIENTESNRDDYTLEVSCWDKSEQPDHTRVMLIADKVKQALTDFRYLDEHQMIMTSRPNMGYIPDPDAMIKRYDVTTTLMTYRR